MLKRCREEKNNISSKLKFGAGRYETSVILFSWLGFEQQGEGVTKVHS
jgi:hypothetical protein